VVVATLPGATLHCTSSTTNRQHPPPGHDATSAKPSTTSPPPVHHRDHCETVGSDFGSSVGPRVWFFGRP
jgi:hypothetical protein